MQDEIKREIIINASKERVYEAIANPEKVTKWFPDAVEGKYAVGEQPIFVFDGFGKSQIYIADARPHEYFAYRWVPGGNGVVGQDVLSVPTTLVEFFIEEANGVTKVTLKESGFASLPVEIAEQSLSQNSGGWGVMLAGLEKYFKGEDGSATV